MDVALTSEEMTPNSVEAEKMHATSGEHDLSGDWRA
jgi:hypothetical protein